MTHILLHNYTDLIVMKDKTRSKKRKKGVHKGDEGPNEVEKWVKCPS